MIKEIFKATIKIFIISFLLCSVLILFTNCGASKEDGEDIKYYIGTVSFIKNNDYLYYDDETKIVYFWNVRIHNNRYDSISPSPYYAANGLPYKYNPETRTFEEIKGSVDD